MLGGYAGKILWADLTAKKVDYVPLDPETATKYIGGVGMAAKILWDKTSARTDAFSPENPLVFMVGPLTGLIPGSSRYAVAAISPLTGIWGEAHSGGDWADELKHAGFDGVVVTGKSKNPVYLWVNEGVAEIVDASHLWGKDTFEVDELLRKETDQKAVVATIGPAGERLVRIAGIMNNGKAARAAARCGLGAVMGHKNLKAVVVRGELKIPIHNEKKLEESIRRLFDIKPVEKESDETLMNKNIRWMYSFIDAGGVPIKNWLEGTFQPSYKFPEDLRTTTAYHCRHCPYRFDVNSRLTDEGCRHFCYEVWAPLGPLCLIDDVKAMQEAANLCNRYGLDTISTGGVIAFAMECYEKGLITKEDMEGIDLRWGNADAMVQMVRKIGERQGFGKILGEGVKRAAEHIGGTASEYAIHVKGLEIPAHDPRASFSFAVMYATGNLGASHYEGSPSSSIEGYLEGAPFQVQLAMDAPLIRSELHCPSVMTRFEVKGKGELVAKTQDFSAMVNSLVVCATALDKYIPPSLFTEMLNNVTGLNLSLLDFMITGERIFNLKRMFNVRRGISRKDDILPQRLLTHKRGSGTAADALPPLGVMLNEYYSFRRWSEEGIPTKERLELLNLAFTSSTPARKGGKA